jgi:PilZ domain
LSEDFQRTHPDAGARFAERRSSPRYALIATVEVTEPVAKIHLSGRTAEISLGGCYVDILNPLPKNSVVQLSIERDQGTFHTWGRVVYVHEGIGMGVQFFDTSSDEADLLKGWIEELSASGWANLS